MRIGVDDDGNIDRVGDGAKIGFDLRVAEREIRFQDRQDAVGAELLVGLRLRDRIESRGRGDTGDHGHASLRGLDRGLHHRRALRAIEIGELAGRAERRQPMHAGFDEIVAETAEHVAADFPHGIDRRDQIGKDAVEVSHVCPGVQAVVCRGSWFSLRSAAAPRIMSGCGSVARLAGHYHSINHNC